MAPEQVRNANTANAAADLYSVSKIFFELIVGVLPSGHWQPPSGGRSDVPKGIDELIERGLKLDRNLRPQTAIEYRDLMIGAFNGGRLPQPPPPPPPPEEILDQIVARIKATPTWVWIALGSFVVLLALIEAALQQPLETCGYNMNQEWVCY